MSERDVCARCGAPKIQKYIIDGPKKELRVKLCAACRDVARDQGFAVRRYPRQKPPP